jgi:hypothetical protein
MPRENFLSHSTERGQCLGMAYVQRAIFYLMRPDKTISDLSEDEIQQIIEMLSRKRAFGTNHFKGVEIPITKSVPFHIFSIPEKDISWETSRIFFQELESRPAFGRVIQAHQNRAAMRLTDRIRSIQINLRDENEDFTGVFHQIQAELARHRMPILELRQDNRAHAVIAKDIQHRKMPNDWEISIYDPNEPYHESDLIFKDGHFLPREFSTLFEFRPVKVGVIEEQSMNEIEQAIFEYYRQVCGRSAFP